MKQRVVATLIARNGKRYVGTNDVDNPQTVCPREGLKTGEGYELCKSVCRQPDHAEIAVTKLAGRDAVGATIYLEGHYYACKPCQAFAANHGVRTIILAAPPLL